MIEPHRERITKLTIRKSNYGDLLDYLPLPNLKHLTIYYFICSQDWITKVTQGCEVERGKECPLPESLEVLELIDEGWSGVSAELFLNKIPSTLKVLSMKGFEGSPLRLVTPNLVSLSWGLKKSESVDSFQELPINSLALTEEFNEPVDHLPASLKFLQLGRFFTRSLDHLPCGLRGLYLYDTYYPDYPRGFNLPLDHLPPNITELFCGIHFDCPLDHLPNTLVTLSLSKFFNQDVDNLPSSLRTLFFAHNSQFNRPVDNLPSQLKVLVMGNHFNLPVDHLPPRLKWLGLGQCFNQTVDHLPLSLTKLDLGAIFNQPVDHLPAVLLEVYFGFEFNQPLDNLPNGLLHPCGNFNFPLHHLPPFLWTLQLPTFYKQCLDFLPLTHLKSLYIKDCDLFAKHIDKSIIVDRSSTFPYGAHEFYNNYYRSLKSNNEM